MTDRPVIKSLLGLPAIQSPESCCVCRLNSMRMNLVFVFCLHLHQLRLPRLWAVGKQRQLYTFVFIKEFVEGVPDYEW